MFVGRRHNRGRSRRGRIIRSSVVLLVLASLLLIAAPPVGVGAALPTKPNIVLILTDDMRAVDLDVLPQTKSLIGGHGVTFTNAFVSTSACCPSRSSILTGQYSHNTKVYDNDPPNGGVSAFKDSSTLATWLKGAGYSTSLIGKYLNGYDTLTQTFVPPGWTDWHAIATGTKSPVYYNYTLNENGTLRSFGSAPADYLTDVLADRAYSFVKTAPGPFFMYFAPHAPHWPAVPGPNDVVNNTAPLPKPPSFNEPDVSDKPWGSTNPPMTQDQINALTWYYRAAQATMQSTDAAVAKVVRGLQERGVLENTVIAFMSDNGMLLGEHRMWNKVWAYDPSIRVPLLFRLPGDANAGSRTDSHFVMNVDLTSTFAELAGITPPLKQNGTSLVPLLNGQNPTWRTGVYVEWLGKAATMTPGKFSAFRTDQYKLIIYQNGTRELYDMNADPHELNNLANNPAYDAAEAQVQTLLYQQAAA